MSSNSDSKVINLYIQGVTGFAQPTEVKANTVRELRADERWTLEGHIAVNGIVATDDTLIEEGNDVAHHTTKNTGGAA